MGSAVAVFQSLHTDLAFPGRRRWRLQGHTRARRIVGACIAVSLNLLAGMLVLWADRHPPVRAPDSTPLPITVFAPTREDAAPPKRRRRHSAPVAPVEEPQQDAARHPGPPTEGHAEARIGVTGAAIRELGGWIALCRERYPETLGALVEPRSVALRLFVMPGGEISQGMVERSSGDPVIDRAALACAERYAGISAVIVNELPVAAWQTVEIEW